MPTESCCGVRSPNATGSSFKRRSGLLMLPLRTLVTKWERSPYRCSSSTFSRTGSAAAATAPAGSAVAEAPTAKPASAALFLRNRLRSVCFGFIDPSCCDLSKWYHTIRCVGWEAVAPMPSRHKRSMLALLSPLECSWLRRCAFGTFLDAERGDARNQFRGNGFGERKSNGAFGNLERPEFVLEHG